MGGLAGISALANEMRATRRRKSLKFDANAALTLKLNAGSRRYEFHRMGTRWLPRGRREYPYRSEDNESPAGSFSA